MTPYFGRTRALHTKDGLKYHSQEMVKVNSTYMIEYLDTCISRANGTTVGLEPFKQIIEEDLQMILDEEVAEYKKSYKIFSGAIDKFMEMKNTKKNLDNQVKKTQKHWIKWYTSEKTIEGWAFKRKVKEMTIARLENSNYNYKGYVTKSWLWYRCYSIEGLYSRSVKQNMWDAYVRKEIPKRGRDKLK